jgi:hypothetical protein
MKNLKILLVTIMVVGFASAAWAIPVLNTTDFFANGNTYGTYTNSGNLLFVTPGNNLGNALRLDEVENLVRSATGLLSLDLVITENINYTLYDSGRTGTWEAVAPDNAISFYAVKAGNAFAMYEVDPSEGTGSWTTFDIWKSGLSGTGGRGGLQISHFTGYNPSTSVPEPATLLLLGLGLIGVAGIGRKLKK